MSKALFAGVLSCVALTVLPAATEPQFSADRFKAHVTFLADDLLEGREAGTRGHEIAARYVAAQFAMLGLKPGGSDGTYFEQVRLAEAVADGQPDVSVTVAGHTRTLKLWEDVIAFVPPKAAGTETADAPLVFAGYGMTDARLGLDDYRGVDARGKIVLLLYGTPKGMDSEIGAHLLTQQGRIASEHGAIGVMTVPTRSMTAVAPWEAVRHFADAPVVTWVQKDGKPFNSAPTLKGGAVLNPAAAESLFEGAPKTLSQVLDEADGGGRPAGFPMKASAHMAITTGAARQFSSPEVIGVIEGSDPALKNEYVALMAHADHIGIAPTGTGDRINNGALDNAAGVATLLEVGRAFATASERPRRSILLVANTAEEKGLLGAEYFAHYPTIPIDRLTAAIDLDMPLLTYDFTDVVAYGASHSTLDEAFREAGRQMGVSLSPDPMPEQAIFVRSDHYAMVKAGVPGVMLATGMANGGAESWQKFLASNYHQPSDDLAQPIRWNDGARFAELNYRAVRVLADAASPARWYQGDYFGDLFAPRAPKAPHGTTR